MSILTIITEYDFFQIIMDNHEECIALGEAFVMEAANRTYQCFTGGY